MFDVRLEPFSRDVWFPLYLFLSFSLHSSCGFERPQVSIPLLAVTKLSGEIIESTDPLRLLGPRVPVGRGF